MGAILADAGYAPVLFPLLFADHDAGKADFPLDLPNSQAKKVVSGYIQKPDSQKKVYARVSILLGIIGDLKCAITLLDDELIKLYPAPLQLEQTGPIVWMSFSIKDMELQVPRHATAPFDTPSDSDDSEVASLAPMDWKAAFEAVLARKVGVTFRNLFQLNFTLPNGIYRRPSMYLYTELSYREVVSKRLKTLYNRRDPTTFDHWPFHIYLYPIPTVDPLSQPASNPMAQQAIQSEKAARKERYLQEHAIRHTAWQYNHVTSRQTGIYYANLHRRLPRAENRSLNELLMEIRVHVPSAPGMEPRPHHLFTFISKYGGEHSHLDGVIFHFSPSVQDYGFRTAHYVAIWFNHFFPELHDEARSLFYSHLRQQAHGVSWDPIEHAPIFESDTAIDDAHDALTTGDTGFLFNLTLVNQDQASVAPSVGSLDSSQADSRFNFSTAGSAMLAAIGAHSGDAATINSTQPPSILRRKDRKVTIGPTTTMPRPPGLPNRLSKQNTLSRDNSSVQSAANASSSGSVSSTKTTGTTHAKLAQVTAERDAANAKIANLDAQMASNSADLAELRALFQSLLPSASRTDNPAGSHPPTGPTHAGAHH